jgi:hypothetical protein
MAAPELPLAFLLAPFAGASDFRRLLGVASALAPFLPRARVLARPAASGESALSPLALMSDDPFVLRSPFLVDICEAVWLGTANWLLA